MDEESFRRYLKKTGHTEKRCESEFSRLRKFEDYLSKHKNKKMGVVTPEDLKDFVVWAQGKKENTNVLLWVLNRYYTCMSNDLMYCAVNELLGLDYLKKYDLKDFLGVNHQHTQALRKEGVFTCEHMLKAGRTEKERRMLAEETGVPPSAILELVKLADMSRIVGLKSKRARLYYDAGVDTVEKMAKWNPVELREMLTGFIEKTKFNGMVPLPKEAKFTVEMARRMPKVIEY